MLDVKIIANGNPSQTMVADAKTGEILQGVAAIDIAIRPDGMVTRLELQYVPIDVTANADVFMVHPATGEFEKIAAILFADGSIHTF
jgi:hypothetical protein